MMGNQRTGAVVVYAIVGVLMMTLVSVAQAVTIGPIEFSTNADYSSNFWSLPGYSFGRSTGPGAGGVAGRMSMTGNTHAGSCVYDTMPDDVWGPDNQMKNVTIAMDVAFTDEVFHPEIPDSPGWQKFGILFNVDANRQTDAIGQDCLMLYFNNVDHTGEPYDQVVLSRGTARAADFGTPIITQDITTGSGIVITPAAAPNYLHLELSLTNSVDNSTLSLSATLTDPSTSTTIATFTAADLDYATTLLGAAAHGEVGVIADNYWERWVDNTLHGSKNSVKWDNFTIYNAPDPTVYWDGGSTVDSNLGTPANWVGDVLPTSSSPVIFTGNVRTSPVLTMDTSYGRILFDANASAFTIGGSATLTLTATGNTVVNESAATQTFALPVAFAGAAEVRAKTGDLTFGALATAGTTSFYDAANLTTRVIGVLSGTGNIEIVEGITELGADSSDPFAGYAGQIAIDGNEGVEPGVLRLKASGAAGVNSGTDVTQILIRGGSADAGTLELTNNITINKWIRCQYRSSTAFCADAPHIRSIGNNTLQGRVYDRTGGTWINIQSESGVLSIESAVESTSSGPRQIRFIGEGHTSITGSGSLTGTAPANSWKVHKLGTGTLTYDSANVSYWGDTVVAEGKLVVTANAAGALTNTGHATYNPTPKLIVEQGATLDVSAAGLTLSDVQTLSGRGTVIGNVVTGNGSSITPGGTTEPIHIRFGSDGGYTDNFYDPPGLEFGRSDGPGADGLAGRISMTGNTHPGSCFYDTAPDDTWGPNNEFKNCTICVDVAFTDEVFAITETPGWQDWGIVFNADANRQTSATDPDCLVLSLRNASHVGETDEIALSRGTGRTGDIGTVIASKTLTGDAIQLTPSASSQYLNVTLDITNSPDNSKLSYTATVTDIATSTVIATLSGTDMDYATTLLAAASQGEIGILAHNDDDRADLIASKNSVKWDNFTVLNGPPPAGDFAGNLRIEGDLDMSAGGEMVWDLVALSEGNPGTDFDALTITGDLTLGGLSQLRLNFDTLETLLRPNAATPDAFWTSDHTWKIIDVDDVAGSLTGAFTSLVNGTFDAGTFTTRISGKDVFLDFDSDVAPLVPGDANGDGKVDADDARRLAQNWGVASGATWSMGDFNGDGKVSAADASILAANWGYDSVGESTAVPEPSVMWMITLMSLVTLGRRSRR